MLEAVKSELLEADESAERDGTAIMMFEECEFEFSIETETDASGKVTVWALELYGGSKQTESNKIRVKYVKLEERRVKASRR